MSDKIDLAEVEKYPLFILDEHVLALVRAVRAAKRFMECSSDDTPGAWREFKDSLVIFTDGAKENSSA